MECVYVNVNVKGSNVKLRVVCGEILLNTKAVIRYALNVKDPDDGMWPSSQAKNPKSGRILVKETSLFLLFGVSLYFYCWCLVRS
jgi:hypothetical protein